MEVSHPGHPASLLGGGNALLGQQQALNSDCLLGRLLLLRQQEVLNLSKKFGSQRDTDESSGMLCLLM